MRTSGPANTAWWLGASPTYRRAVATQRWWGSDSSERYWMEITDRPDVGGDLTSPQRGNKGQAVGHYIVDLIQPGDIVFHWFTGGSTESSLIGWSEAVGPLRVEQLEWSPHAGSMAGTQTGRQPNWVMPIAGLHLLARPIKASQLTARRDEIFAIRDELQRNRSSRGPLNFPFILHTGEIRGFQGYMTKMPAALVALLQEIGDLELDLKAVAGEVELDETLVQPQGSKGPIRIQTDTVRRQAVELHAVQRTIELYRAEGATDITVLGKPYDLLVRFGSAERHVEVKGSSGPADAVLVTRNEVTHARGTETDLVVVDRIVISAAEDGTITTSGGRTRRWRAWVPADEHLSPTAFECDLPDGPEFFEE